MLFDNLLHCRISANKRSLNMEYLPALRLALTRPLIELGGEGVASVIGVMGEYDLLREDFDSIVELSAWPGMKDPMSLLDSKVRPFLFFMFITSINVVTMTKCKF